MKILFVSLLLPHPGVDHASAFSEYKMIRYLSERHDVSLISFVRSDEERELSREMLKYCRRVETVLLPGGSLRKLWVRANLLTLTPMSISNSHCREMRNVIRSMTKQEKFDIVQMEHAPMGQYVSEIGNSATVIRVHDLVFVTAKKHAKHLRYSRKKVEWFIESLVSRRYESRQYAKFDSVLAISGKMKDVLLDCNSSLNVLAIPPGVDIPERRKLHGDGKGKNLIFMGAMWRRENIESVLYFYWNVFSLVRKAVPEVKLNIVGGSPSQEITNLADDSSVKITGYVEDLSDYYLKCDVSIAPMRIAGGIMCKVLDAMAFGLPVVTTSQGNEGIGAEARKEIFVEDDPEDFADRTIELLQDGRLRKTVSDNALDFIRRNFSWEDTTNKLESLYRKYLL